MAAIAGWINSKTFKSVLGLFILAVAAYYFFSASQKWKDLTDFCTQDKVGMVATDFFSVANSKKLFVPETKLNEGVIWPSSNIIAGSDTPACVFEIENGRVLKILLDSPVFKSNQDKLPVEPIN